MLASTPAGRRSKFQRYKGVMEMLSSLRVTFPPSNDLLLHRIREQIDDEMLWEIARADNGDRAEEAMVGLRYLRDTGRGPDEAPFIFSEVLSLTRFSDPDRAEPPPFERPATGFRGHQQRLFACAALLVVWPNEASPDYTVAQAIVSAGVIGEEMTQALGCYLTWRVDASESLARLQVPPGTVITPELEALLPDAAQAEGLMPALALLVIANRMRPHISESELAAIARWVLALESLKCRLDPTPIDFGVVQGVWRPHAAELNAAPVADPTLAAFLQLCALIMHPAWD